MGCASHCENGCVDAAAIFTPTRSAMRAAALRFLITSRRTAAMSSQMPVATSTTDWCSSAWISISSSGVEASTICEMKLFSSRVTGSMIWYSSSTPSVNSRDMPHRAPFGQRAS